MPRLYKLISTAIVLFALLTCAHAAPPTVISESAVLIDADTGQVLYNKEMHKQQYPASITKIATVIVGLENAALTDKIVMSDEAVFSVGRNTSHIALTPDEEITLEQACYAALMMSANDACNGIAELVSGKIPDFVALMNEKAAEYGAVNTHFNNANGLKDSEHYTTAYDMAMICRHAIKNDTFKKMFGTRTYTMPPNNKQSEERHFANQHSMISDPNYSYDGIIGGKAGWTTAAQYTLVTAATRNGRTLIAAVMKSPRNDDKYNDTRALFDYGFAEFDTLTYTEEELLPSGGYALDEKNTSVLVPKGTEKSAVRIATDMRDGKDYVILSIASAPEYMPTELEKIPCTAIIDVSKTTSEEAAPGVGFWGVFGMVLLAVIAAILLLVLFFFIRKQIYKYKKKRHRRK